jgi:hypothetical protein
MILRNLIVAAALVGLALALFGAFADPAVWPMAVMSALIAAVLLFERHRYQERLKVPSKEELRPTEERFIDPESGRPVRVWLDPAGKRFYLDEPKGGR